MKIEAFAICYNEEALLPYYLRHYSQFCDQIIIFDNYSTDRSEEICLANPKVKLVKYDSGNQIRDDIYLQIKNNCWKNSNADWVIVGDIDELVYHADIVKALKDVTLSEATIITPRMFNMYSEKFPVTEGQIYEEVTYGIPCGSKTNVFRPRMITNINYDPGCHEAHPEGNVIFYHVVGMKTFHMRYLSKQWVIDRNEQSYKRLSELNKQLGWGIHYHATAQKISEDFDRDIKQAIQVI
jgi:glycosyltransferase involved in cell wall biosynthesis